MLDIHLRPFMPDDSSALARVWHASWLSTGLPVARDVSQQALLERVRTELSQGRHLTVAERDGELLGFLALKLEERCLDQLFVAPEHKGSGIGTRLFALALTTMPEGFSLRTAAVNIEARRFYERRGMQLNRLETHSVHGHEVAVYVMP